MRVSVSLFLLLALGCGRVAYEEDASIDPADVGVDTAPSETIDSGMDAVMDAAMDAAMDAVMDSSDGGSDASLPDAEPDTFVPDASCGDGAEEPNDVEAMALRRMRDPPYGCDYMADFDASLQSETDEDWYVLSAVDLVFGGCVHSARVDATGLTTCIYALCALGDSPTVSCDSGDPSTSPAGVPGCCSVGGAPALQVECIAGSGTFTTIYVSVSGASGAMCVPYRASYGAAPP